ncbi:MAG: ATP-binding protein [Desulfomonilaceae bacterium]|nr:ATP-binding protein [Desulfomonilaceae bacterium]
MQTERARLRTPVYDFEPGLHVGVPFPCTPPRMLRWLQRHRYEIIEEWVNRIQRVSEPYGHRPRQELYGTITEAFDADVEVLAFGRLDRMERFINYITKKRLEAGFPLSDVQKAFELFRFIVVRKLKDQGLLDLLADSVDSLNACLSYTIHRFSDHFQTMHQMAILRHAQNLEKEIEVRTAELAAGERRYKTLVEEIHDGYFVIQDQRIVFANRSFCRMHGAELEEILGKPFLDFVAPDCRERVFESYRASLNGKPVGGQLEYTRLGCAPEKAATEIRSRVVDLGQGPMMIGICRDVSERVAMEAKVRENERMAYVGHLTASLSHEIRNPLSAIKMNLQILSRKLDLDGFDLRRLEITVNEVSRLERILRQLLDTARPLNIVTATVNLSDLVRGCVELLEPEAAEKDVAIVQRHARRPAPAQLDAGKLEQAVINLLLNAIEASPNGGRVTVWTKSLGEHENQAIEFGVRDNGAGIDREHKPHLFTPFFTSKTQGTGLGLSNVKRIVEAHSGEVTVRSRKGRGATFLLRLPCKP